MPQGFVMDAYPDEASGAMRLWIKSEGGTDRLYSLPFSPCFYVGGSEGDLQRLQGLLQPLQSVRSVAMERRKLELHGQRERPVLAVTMADLCGLPALAARVERLGDYRDFRLFNVDLRLPHRFFEHHGVYPTALVSWSGPRPPGQGGLTAVGDRWAPHYPLPPLRTYGLSTVRRRLRAVPSQDDPLQAVVLQPLDPAAEQQEQEPLRVEVDPDGDEASLLRTVHRTLQRLDPDVLTTVHGDGEVLPHLYARAAAAGVVGEVFLGREPPPRSLQPLRRRPGGGGGSDPGDDEGGRSFFTYGKMVYKPRAHLLRGRFHVDRRNFHITEGGLLGVLDLSRISGVPVQENCRLSPGSTVSLMYVAEAMRRGVLVKWKKNLPEELKTLGQLARSDRGGLTLTPLVGVFEDVHELDFSALYPSIMVSYNISPETLWCDHPLCRAPQRRVPELGYWFCAAVQGVVPTVLQRILQRRRAFKVRRATDPMAAQVDALLKWVGVVCFGYTGYRNARFGRIECHEAIGAYARETLLASMGQAQQAGFEVLHGIVDSLWLQGPGDAPALAERITASLEPGLRLDYEGHFRWVVFLPNRTTGVGALTRYYGALDDGSLKVRGVEVRQRSTPDFLRTVQERALQLLAQARTRGELDQAVQRVLDDLCAQRRALVAQQVDARSLLLRIGVSKERGGYAVMTAAAAAVAQFAAQGVELHPGQSVSYLVTKERSRRWQRKVLIEPLVEPSTRYDADFYVRLLHRTVASLLLPLGWDEQALAAIRGRPGLPAGALQGEAEVVGLGQQEPLEALLGTDPWASVGEGHGGAR